MIPLSSRGRRRRAFSWLASSALATAALLAAAPASAAEEGDTPPPASEWRYRGHAFYAGIGAGAIADEAVPTMSARLLGVAALSDWAMFEGMFMAYHYSAEDHHGVSNRATGLGLGLGFRVAPAPDWVIRPYAALRVAHLHLTPDHWGEHETLGSTDVDDHHSVHRFGGALAAGFDAPLGGEKSHWRIGVDVEALAMGGPGANLFLQGVATLGYAL